MSDWIDTLLNRVGISGNSSKALQFVVGAGLVALSLAKYSGELKFLSAIGILFGGYLILKSIQ